MRAPVTRELAVVAYSHGQVRKIGNVLDSRPQARPLSRPLSRPQSRPLLRLSRRELLACVPLVIAACAESAPVARAKPVTHTVRMEGTQFQPGTLVVNRGDSITWINADPFPHTATSEAGGFDSGELAPGASWTYEATAPGEFPYVCTLHPTMTGTLRVM